MEEADHADDPNDDDAVEYRMCIGVARSPGLERFDHSWVEAGPLVYDVAVYLTVGRWGCYRGTGVCVT
jgi:hypothetical protein